MFRGFQRVRFQQQTAIVRSNAFVSVPSFISESRPQTVPVMDGLIAWWEPTSGITLVSGNISSWVDRISGISVTQGTAAARPTQLVETLGGVRNVTYVYSTGGNRFLSSTSSALTIGTSPGWTLMSLSYDTGVQSGSLINAGLYNGGPNSVAGGGYAVRRNNNDRQAQFGDSTTRTVSFNNRVSANSVAVDALVIDRNAGIMTGYEYSLTAREYMIVSTAIDANTNNLGNPGAFYVGSVATSSTYSVSMRNGDVLVYNRALSAEEVALNQNFYRRKYGI